MSQSSNQGAIIGPTLGSGSHQLQLQLAEDLYAGDVQVTISVNGVQVGGIQSVTAQQALGSAELFTLNGNWTGMPTVSVNFLNDAWNGSTGNGNDRNLYVDGVSYDRAANSTTTHAVLWNGPSYYTTSPVAHASDFLETIGVTTHLLYGDTSYDNETLVLSSLAYLGIDHVRDGGGMLDPNAVLPFEQAMAAGIKFNFTSSTDGGVATEITRLKTLVAAHPGGITSIEGINEASASFTYAGLTGQAGALHFQQDLFTAVKVDPALASIPVINYTLLSQDPADYTRYGDVSSTADLGNIHLYPYGGLQTLTSTLLPRELEGTPQSAGYVITEFGYDTMSNAEDIQAKYVLDGLLDAFQAGASATYLYELLDDRPDSGMTDVENHFGLFRADGTAKPAAIALHNLTTILADPGAGAFTPGSLGYSVTGLPATGRGLLLAKSDGSSDLVLWAEPLIRASSTSPAEIAAPLKAVTVTFDRTEATILVYDPLIGTAPIASYVHASSVTIGITDHPIILSVKPIVSPDITPPDLTMFESAHGIINASTVTLSGTTSDYGSGISRVEVFDFTDNHKVNLGAATVDTTGHWTFSATRLSDGTHQFSAISVDNNFNSTTAVSAGVDVIVDTIRPQPIIKTITGNRDGSITISGISEASSSISLTQTLRNVTRLFGQTTTSKAGTWSFTSSSKVDMSGVSSFSVSSQDLAGNSSLNSNTLSLFSNSSDTLYSSSNLSTTYSIMSSRVSNSIYGFKTTLSGAANHDYINFSGRGVSSFSQVKSLMAGTLSTTISVGNGKSVTIADVAPSLLSPFDFIYS